MNKLLRKCLLLISEKPITDLFASQLVASNDRLTFAKKQDGTYWMTYWNFSLDEPLIDIGVRTQGEVRCLLLGARAKCEV